MKLENYHFQYKRHDDGNDHRNKKPSLNEQRLSKWPRIISKTLKSYMYAWHSRISVVKKKYNWPLFYPINQHNKTVQSHDMNMTLQKRDAYQIQQHIFQIVDWIYRCIQRDLWEFNIHDFSIDRLFKKNRNCP